MTAHDHRGAGRHDAINRTARNRQPGRRVDYERGHVDSPHHGTGRINGPRSFDPGTRSKNREGRHKPPSFQHGGRAGGIRKIVMKHLILSLLAVATLSAAQGKQTFTGTITDEICGKAGHSQMQMGPTDAECTLACISAHGATYVLYDGKDLYALSDQQTPEKFAGQRVRVIGSLDHKTKTIQVDSMTAAR